MSWRTVVISNRCKLDLKMGYMVIRGEETKRIYLDEIGLLIIENTAVSFTGCLLSALIEKKIKVIFCDEKRNPQGELVPCYGSYDCSRKIKSQIGWSHELKGAVWTEIVSAKIRMQAGYLDFLGYHKQADMLKDYISEMEFYDATNREGHAAKVYFNALFGMDFTRSDNNVTNAALNYGYSILLSAFNREVASNGYLTQLGLFHDNMFNNFNLSCDLMEPFRILVDKKVNEMKFTAFEKEEKHCILSILSDYVLMDNNKQTVLNAIKLYTKGVFDALGDGELSRIKSFKVI